MAEYPVNKGIGRPVEFKGLKAQYLFIFCGGLLALFVLFVILYMVGIDQWICIGFGAAVVFVASPGSVASPISGAAVAPRKNRY